MTKAMQCAKETAKFLAEEDLTYGVYIYIDGKRYKIDDKGNLLYDIDADPHDYLEFCSDFMSMSFDGLLYDVLDYNENFTYCIKVLDSIFKKYNKYLELYYRGNVWELSLYEI